MFAILCDFAGKSGRKPDTKPLSRNLANTTILITVFFKLQFFCIPSKNYSFSIFEERMSQKIAPHPQRGGIVLSYGGGVVTFGGNPPK